MVMLLLACEGKPPGGHDSDAGKSDTAGVVDTMDSDTGETAVDTQDTHVPVDEDGDGYGDMDDGGDDCDDADSAVHPGADEWCDDVDSDCDGEPVGPGGCSEVQPFSTRAQLLNDVYSYQMPVRDITGDGFDDVLTWDGTQLNGVIEGEPDLNHLQNYEYLTQFVPRRSYYYYNDALWDVGDIDGDGLNDLAFEESSWTGTYCLYWGPITPASGESEPTMWDPGFEDYDYSFWQNGGSASGDFNGDGGQDLVKLGLTTDSTMRVYFGGSRDQRISTFTSGLFLFPWTFANTLGDVDGDGMDDLALGGDHDSAPLPLSWISGADLAVELDGSLTDVIRGEFVDSHAEDSTPCGPTVTCIMQVGDWSGDGYEDVILGTDDETDSYAPGYLEFYDTFGGGDVSPTGVLDNDTIPERLGYVNTILYRDGVASALLIPTEDIGHQFVLLDRGWYVGTWQLSETQHLTLDGGVENVAEVGLYTAGGRGDITGDGWSDVTAMVSDGTHGTGTWLLNPFSDIPWDEPTYW